LRDVIELMPNFPREAVSADAFLHKLVLCRNFDVTKRLAKYTFEVFKLYATSDVLKPAEYLFHALQ
jgi:hypothetical protein